MEIGVIGAGSWGTALARMLGKKGWPVWLYGRNPSLIEALKRERENAEYLPGFKLPEGVHPTADIEEAVAGRELVLVVVPSHGLRQVMKQAAAFLAPGSIVVSCTKGIEVDTLLPMSAVIQEVVPAQKGVQVAALSGPSFAREVAMHMPTAVSVACHDLSTAERVQQALATEYFRIYTSTDLIGVELGGATKNVIAIATGIADGMGLGTNTRAALITRGIAEMVRLGLSMGANPMTFAGLAGLGDLVLTCTGELSRNRQVGLKIGQGLRIKDILAQMKMVAEGVINAQSTYKLAQKMEVPMPITEQIYLILYADKSPKMALLDLMGRKLKQEFWL